MKYRLYGQPQKLLLHGGPGAIGSVSGFAADLGDCIEVLNYGQTIEDQLKEIHDIVEEFKIESPTLIGHSWGAWLAFLYACKYETSRIILIGCGAFKTSYLEQMDQSRQSKLTKEEEQKAAYFFEHMTSINDDDLLEFGRLMSKMDAYELVDYKDKMITFDAKGHQMLMDELRPLRTSGKLLEMGRSISAEIVIIHGKEDPHPYKGVTEPFDEIGIKYDLILLEECGHSPWIEKYAKDMFYEYIKSI